MMKCPVCKSSKYDECDLHAEGFTEDIIECHVCGTVWSVNHGMAEVVRDVQRGSFLEAVSERVEGGDYGYAGI